ncbi:MAG: sigma-54-dependent Fis family transcriptional regulator [Candidatus Eisenbacteria sp.]|nr:sigma-54-dependent Fis family transcriptional regulator [Candidatus Eisenbacteria bacterium]
MVARAIHRHSERRRHPWVAINCGALPGELHESELFGHARGAFTGAVVEKRGLFEAADGGTLFLDEIGEMDPRAQAKLLRVLDSGELRRLGETRTRHVATRVIAATNTRVDEAVAQGRFRQDLFYRLGAIRMALPPLRDRPGDILPLAEHFLRCSLAWVPPFSPAARRALLHHPWHGNVRELKFAIERAAVLWNQQGGAELDEALLMLDGHLGGAAARPARAAVRGDGSSSEKPPVAGVEHWPVEVPVGLTLESLLAQVETRLIAHALEQAGENRTQAARLLGGISRTTLIGKMKRLGLFP